MQQEPSQKAIRYDLLPQCSIKQKSYCRAIAINNNNSLLLAGSQSIIKVYQFNQGMMKCIQYLNKHEKIVTTLNFFNQGYFISGSDDGSIIMWQKNLISKAKYIQSLKNHSKSILCVILNNKENLIVSGSYDTTIKFWNLPFKNLNQWSCTQTLSVHTQPVYGLSMNEEQTKLVSCGYDSIILVIEYQENLSTWMIKQNIKVDLWGYRVCFINNNMFTYQPQLSTCLYIFLLDQKSQTYLKSYNLAVKDGGSFCSSLFPSTFNQEKNIILDKNGCHLNLIRLTKNKNKLGNEEQILKLEQSINLGTDLYGIANIFGTMSKDGNYLISWDARTEQIQVRLFKG
ncbi:unnamed protein product [Paramecium pentaurelia]|uniref:Uncharacterized protein n=1 Tax=Paramecium pentaurelia TaxID=43138 RepID=A0A8S1UMX5_9CILI|nr:unnamed protein product [Paramecium pentaurelia]